MLEFFKKLFRRGELSESEPSVPDIKVDCGVEFTVGVATTAFSSEIKNCKTTGVIVSVSGKGRTVVIHSHLPFESFKGEEIPDFEALDSLILRIRAALERNAPEKAAA